MAIGEDKEFATSEEVKKTRGVSPTMGGGARRRRKVRRGRPSIAEIEEKIKVARDKNASRNDMMADIDDVYKRVYSNLKQDVAETDIPMIKTPRGEAILDVFYSLLTIGATLNTQVLPLKSGAGEQKLCTSLERGLDGIQFEIESATGKVPYQDGVHFFLRKGLGVWKPIYLPRATDCPIRVEAPDPQHVYPVEEDELLWVVEDRWKYVGQYRKHLEHLRSYRPKGGKLGWSMPKMEGLGPLESVKVTSYQDKEWEALKVGDEYVYIRPNYLEMIRYGFGKCRRTPDADAAWASQGILGPMLGLLLLETEILTKFGTSLSLFFYPYLLSQEPDGKATILKGAPGEFEDLSPEAKITVLQAGSNIGEAQNLLAQAQSLANIIGLPTVMFGEPPGQVQAGYPMSLLMNAARTRLRREAQQIEWGLGRSQEIILRTIEKFGGMDGGIPVYVGVEGSKRGQKALMTLTDKDVQGHYRVKVTVSPKLPQDWMQLSTVVDRLRKENKAGEPMISDKTLREMVLEMEKPDEEEERLFEQEMMKDPEVLEHMREKWRKEWRKREKILSPEEKLARTQALLPPPRVRGGPPQQQQGAGMPGMPPAMGGGPPRAPMMPGEEGPEDLMRQMMPPAMGR